MSKKKIVEYFIEYMGKFFKTTSKSTADVIKKNNPRVRVTTKAPKGLSVTNLKPPPKSLRQPQNPKTGKFQKPAPAPVRVTPKKFNTPTKTDKKPSKVPSVPKKKPNAMTASPKKPSRPGDDAKVVGGSKSRPSDRDYTVRSVRGPKPKTSAPAVLRSSTLEGGPQLNTTPPEDKKKEQDRKTKPKTVDPKKTKPPVKAPPRKGPPTKKKPSKKPQQRPAQGPVTNESFAAAFKRNRSAKKPTFTWKGKLYTTRYKEESIAEHKKKFGVEGKYKK
jgi:hypothetical protein